MIVCSMYTHRFALHPLGGQRAGGNSRATAKCFEPGIHNLPLVVHLNLSKQSYFFFYFLEFYLSARAVFSPKITGDHNHIAAVIFTICKMNNVSCSQIIDWIMKKKKKLGEKALVAS